MYAAIQEMNELSTELLRMHELNVELLDTLTVLLSQTFDFADKHNIPIEHYDALAALIKRATVLHTEIVEGSMPKFLDSRRKVTDFDEYRNDGEVTEPNRISQ